jgi:two-component system sensor histidine kinase RpfC
VVIFDQLYLAALSFLGLPFYLTLPLSGTLVFMTRSLGINYLFMSMPVAFGVILFALVGLSEFQLNVSTASAIAVLLVIIFSLNSTIPLIKSAIRKRDASSDSDANQNKTHDSKLMKQPISSLASSIKEKTGLRILLISTDHNRLRTLTEHLINWGYDYTTSNNSVQAFRHMLSHYQAERFVPYTILIVDQQGLDLDPVSLARLIRCEPRLEGLKLICFKASFAQHHQPQDFYTAGYNALLENPLSKALLFSALHMDQRHDIDSTNIISLCNHRANKTRETEQGIILLADTPSSERTHLNNALIQAGYLVQIVDDGDQALDILEEKPIGLAIINIKLNIMSGIQIFKLHRFTTPYKQWVPFVFLSDENSADTLRLCRSIGVQACLFKPVVSNDLLEIIPTLLSQNHTAKSNKESHPKRPVENNVTQFQNPGLLDHMTLLRLEKLDSGISFINDLLKIFETEGTAIISTMRRAVDENRFNLFLDQAQILLDSAGQLGAFSLYELNRGAARLQPHEFECRGCQILEEIEKTFNLTLEAYTYYLSQRAAALQKEHP